MLSRAILIPLSLLIAGIAVAQAPGVLIYQAPIKVDNKMIADKELAFVFANQAEKEFNVAPVVWSLTDPTIRDAMNRGLIGGDIDGAALPVVRNSMSAVNAQYLAIVESGAKNGRMIATLRLFKGTSSRPFYQKSLEMGAEVDGNADPDSARESTVRTWLLELKKEEWKALARNEGVPDNPSGGTGIPLSPTVEHQPIVPVEQIVATADKFIAAKDPLEAAAVLYSGIDMHPKSIDLRTKLIQVLQSIPKIDLATIELFKAVRMAPERIDLRILVARNFLKENRLEEAGTELNEALARAPEDPEVLLLAGDIAMHKGRLEEAQGHYLRANALSAGPINAFTLAIPIAASGESAETLRLLGLSASEDERIKAEQFDRLARYGRLAANSIGEALKNVILGVRVAQDRSPHIARAQRAQKGAECLTMLAERVKALPGKESIQEKRILAHKLLVQAAGAVLEYAKTGNEDIASEAQISLSDAIRRFSELPG